MKQAKFVRCVQCRGYGSSVHTHDGVTRIVGGACPGCSGSGYVGAKRLRSLLVGDHFELADGTRWQVFAKRDERVACTQDGSDRVVVRRDNPVTMLLLRPEVVFFNVAAQERALAQ